jgi:hypothetical protein
MLVVVDLVVVDKWKIIGAKFPKNQRTTIAFIANDDN